MIAPWKPWTPALAPHCEAGEASIEQTFKSAYMGKDWLVRCPCGYKEKYVWVSKGFAADRWNERRRDED